MEHFQKESCVRGHRVYKDLWDTAIGEELVHRPSCLLSYSARLKMMCMSMLLHLSGRDNFWSHHETYIWYYNVLPLNVVLFMLLLCFSNSQGRYGPRKCYSWVWKAIDIPYTEVPQVQQYLWLVHSWPSGYKPYFFCLHCNVHWKTFNSWSMVLYTWQCKLS